VDRIWLSHANLDHFSGVLDVLDRIPCGPVVSTPYFDIDCGPDTPGETLLDELKSRGRVVEVANAPETMTFDSEATFEILWPPDHPPFELSANNSSLLARIEYRWYRILLCGDIEEAAQRWLMEHEDVDADVLVMPHHGSVRTNLSEFVTAVDPEYVVISGDRRRVRLSSSLLEMLDGREVFNTADDGAVRVSILEDDLSVRSWIGR
jgi:competence protein ComEC